MVVEEVFFLLKVKHKKALAAALVLAVAASAFFAGCGSKSQRPGSGATAVKAMKVLQQDAPLTTEYAGTIAGKDEVKVQSKVSGNVVEKYVQGGETVRAGQPLYRIDSRQYQAAVLQAQATLARSQATLANAQTDLGRDESLYASNAVPEQTLTTQQTTVATYAQEVQANQALLDKAQEDLADTMIYAPISGQLGVDDVAVGTMAGAGTSLVTIGSTDPVYAKFSLSEAEYLKLRSQQSAGQLTIGLKLADGSTYPEDGKIVAVDRELKSNTSSLTVKALFPNPDHLLLPGMFARVRLSGQVIPNALLVPERAIQQLLNKTFVMVVGADGKSVAKSVELGDKIGSYYVVKSGLSAEDNVIVEGLSSLTEGKELNVTMVTPEDMGFSFEEDNSEYDSTKSSDGQNSSSSSENN